MTLPKEFEYQRFAREKIKRRGKTALIAPPGAGKTRPIVQALSEQGMFHKDRRVLVMCTGPAVATWLRQLPLWSGDPLLSQDVHVSTGAKRIRMHSLGLIEDYGGVAIMNPACFRLDFDTIAGIKWDAIVADEYHKFMRSRKAETFVKFLRLTRHMDTVVLASGSLVSRDPRSMFTAFQIVAPTHFTGFWKFANTYCVWDETPYGKEFVGIKNLEALRRIMDRYHTYIPKEVVADQLPLGSRQAIDATMTKEQHRIYHELAEDMIAEIEDDIIVAPNVLSKLVKLRQLLCCPKILDESLGMGGGFELIADKLEETPHAAIFVPFRPAVTFIAEALKEAGHDVVWLRGGVSAGDQADRTEHFRQNKGVIVCTIQYAESFDLETCATSYFLGYDYSLDQNEQAEGRTTRAISAHEFVTWNYVRYLGTIDEDLLEKLNEDMINVRKILGRPQELIDALRGTRN